jgi:N-acetylmuramoyl-L-alanine amidase
MLKSKLNLKHYTCIILTFFLTGAFPVLQIHAQNVEVVAEKGEGIYRLLNRNGLPATDYMDSFIRLNKERLGKENSLFAGRKYVLPEKVGKAVVSSGARSVRHEIFGAKHADIDIVDDELKGAVYYLVPDTEVPTRVQWVF